MKKNLCLICFSLFVTLQSFATTHVISVANFSFTPAAINITLGDTIQWVFLSGTHTTTSLTVPAGALPWSAPINTSSTSFKYKPAVTGTYTYVCNFHPTMLGNFTVTSCPAVSGQISASGPTTVCKPATVTLNAFVSAGSSIQWQKNGVDIAVGGNGTSYVASVSGSYRVRLFNNCGSTFTTNAISVVVNSLPNVSITNGGDTIFKCAADSATITATTTTSGSVTYQWFKGSTLIAGATSSIYKTKKTGSYKVVITKSSTGCSKTSKVVKVVNNCREFDAINANSIDMQIKPNPASDQIYLSLASLDTDADVQILNITGQLMQQKHIISDDVNNETSFDISNLPNGIYILLVKTESQITGKRFVKE